MRFERRSSGVPSQEFLFLTDFLHHRKHGFVIEVINKPNIGLARILLEGNSITINDFDSVADNLS